MGKEEVKGEEERENCSNIQSRIHFSDFSRCSSDVGFQEGSQSPYQLLHLWSARRDVTPHG